METDVATLNAKIDQLSAQVSVLTGYLEQQQKRQAEFDELKRDVIPMANHMIKLTIDELAEIGNEFELEDLLFLGKRILRDTHMFMKVLDRFEGMMGLADEVGLLGQQVFNSAVESLDQMERQGYFSFIRGLNYVAERVVSEFGEQDVIALGDNIVTILSTVRNMTQPQVLEIANRAIGAIQDEPESETISTWALLRELSDPQVRKGMARMLNMVYPSLTRSTCKIQFWTN